MHTITLPKVPDEALDYAIVGADGSLQQLRLSEGQANELLCALASLGLEGPDPAMDLEKVILQALRDWEGGSLPLTLGSPEGQLDDIADEILQAIARAGHDRPGARITWEGIRDIVGVVLLETFSPGTKREEVAADRIMAHLKGTGARELSEACKEGRQMHTITLSESFEGASIYVKSRSTGDDGFGVWLTESQASELQLALAGLGLGGVKSAERLDLEQVIARALREHGDLEHEVFVDELAAEIVQAIARAGHGPRARITWEASRAEVARIVDWCVGACRLDGETGDHVFIKEATKNITKLFEGPPQSGRLTFAELDAIRSLVDHAAATTAWFAARSESRAKLVRDIRLTEDALNRLAEGAVPGITKDAAVESADRPEMPAEECRASFDALHTALSQIADRIGLAGAPDLTTVPDELNRFLMSEPYRPRRLRCWHCGEACSTPFHPNGPWNFEGTVECSKCSADADEDSPYGPAGGGDEAHLEALIDSRLVARGLVVSGAIQAVRDRVDELNGRLSALEGLPAGNDYKARLEAIVDSRIASSLATSSHVQAVSQRVDKLEDLHAGDWIDHFRNRLEASEDLRFDERLESLSHRLAALEDLPAIDLRIEEKLGPTLEAVRDRLSKLEAAAVPTYERLDPQKATHRAAVRQWIARERELAEAMANDVVGGKVEAGRYAAGVLNELEAMLDDPDLAAALVQEPPPHERET